MLIEQFVLLSDLEKQKVVSANGIFLGYNEDKGNTCDIYAVFKFFVEFDYDIYQNEGVTSTACRNLEELPALADILQPRIIEQL